MNEFIVRRDGAEIGRYSRPNLIRFIRAGRICATDEISSDGGSTWQGVAISAFASYVVAGAPPTAPVTAQRAETVRQPQPAVPRTPTVEQPPQPAADWAPFQQAMASFTRFVRSPLGVVLMAGIMLLLVVVGGISAWKWMTPLSAEEQVITDWLDQYRKTIEMLEQFSSAIKKSKPADEVQLLSSYAEKFQIQANLLASMASDSRVPSQRQDLEQYAAALGEVGALMDASVKLGKRQTDQGADTLAKILAGTLMSVGTGDSGALLSAVGSSLWDANTLSSAEKQLVEALEVATRNLKAADTIIQVKYLK